MARRKRQTGWALRRNMGLGTVCANCGKECGRDIEYHHIVPLECGGRDVIENIVPLCLNCHSLITHGHVRKKPEKAGRPRRVYDKIYLERIFSMYINKEISEKEARRALGTGSHIREMPHFKDWAELNGIDIGKVYGQSGRWYKKLAPKGWHLEK